MHALDITNVNITNKECKKCKQYGHSPKSCLCKANKKSYEKHESNRKKTNRTEIVSSESSSNEESTSNSSSSDNENIQTIYTSKKKYYPKILTLKVDHSRLSQTCKSATIKGGRRQKHNNHRSSYKKDYHTAVIINDCAVNVLIDTGADINVMSQDIATTNGRKVKLKYDHMGLNH